MFMLIKRMIQLAQENLHSGTLIMFLNVASDNFYQKIAKVKILIIFVGCILLVFMRINTVFLISNDERGNPQ